MTAQDGSKVLIEIDSTMKEAAEDAVYWFGHAATIFDNIRDGLVGGHLSGDEAYLISLSEVCARAFRSVAKDEGERLQRVGMAFRDTTNRVFLARFADQNMLFEKADAEQAKGNFPQAAYLRPLARGEIDPLEPDGVPKGKQPIIALKGDQQ